MDEISPPKVLFLCVHNSSRSIMAEALVNHYLADNWRAYSAGTDPKEVNSLAIRALRELGIEITGAKSKHLNVFTGQHFDCVITLCDEAKESCPLWSDSTQYEHIGFPDPSTANGDDLARLKIFREIRDQIKEKIIPKLLELRSNLC